MASALPPPASRGAAIWEATWAACHLAHYTFNPYFVPPHPLSRLPTVYNISVFLFLEFPQRRRSPFLSGKQGHAIAPHQPTPPQAMIGDVQCAAALCVASYITIIGLMAGTCAFSRRFLRCRVPSAGWWRSKKWHRGASKREVGESTHTCTQAAIGQLGFRNELLIIYSNGQKELPVLKTSFFFSQNSEWEINQLPQRTKGLVSSVIVYRRGSWQGGTSCGVRIGQNLKATKQYYCIVYKSGHVTIHHIHLWCAVSIITEAIWHRQ